MIEAVSPEVDGGRFAVKRVLGDVVTVEADAFADGHDVVAVVLRHGFGEPLDEAAMTSLGNDRWQASFTVDRLGTWTYAVVAWTDAWQTWRRDLEKRI